MLIWYLIFPRMCAKIFAKNLYRFSHYEVLSGASKKVLIPKEIYGRRVLRGLRIFFRDKYRIHISEIVSYAKVSDLISENFFVEELRIYTHYDEFRSNYRRISKKTLEKELLSYLEAGFEGKNYHEILNIAEFAISTD